MPSDGVFGLIAIVLAFALLIAKEKLLAGRSQKKYLCMLATPLIQNSIGKDQKTALWRKWAPNNASIESGLSESEASHPAVTPLWVLPEITRHEHRHYIQ
jgi:hypothetical protein